MSNLTRTRRERDGVPHLQVPRRTSLRSSSALGRLASPTVSSPIIPTAGGSRYGVSEPQSSLAPDKSDVDANFTSSRPFALERTKSYGGTGQSSRRRSKITSGEALDLATGGTSLRKSSTGKSRTPTSTPASSSFRTSKSRSFLLPVHTSSGISGTGSGKTLVGSSGNKLSSTMTPLPKPKRTSKTSQKLVFLPSAPQTRPLPDRLILLDEGQETSDDAALPRVALRRRFPGPPAANIPRLFADQAKLKAGLAHVPIHEEESPVLEKKVQVGVDHETHPMKRVREYKSAAERMSKEERKKAGYKRITAYCIAEGFKMKALAGFLKREHNVHSRVFDEALYATYHLPLLPGYGPHINVRSSPPAPIETNEDGPSRSLQTRLEEEEADHGYHATYFPQTPAFGGSDTTTDFNHLTASSSQHNHQEAEAIPISSRTHGAEGDNILPGLVRAPSVEEVRGEDGYVTSGSFPPIDAFSREFDSAIAMNHTPSSYESYASFNPRYNPYPSSSEASTSPLTLRDVERRSSKAQAPATGTSTQLILPTSSLIDAEGYHGELSESRALASDAAPSPGGNDIESSIETDDPGAFTDPGVYGPWRAKPRSQLTISNDDNGAISREGEDTDERSSSDDGPLHHDPRNRTIQDLSALTWAEIIHQPDGSLLPLPDESGSDVTPKEGVTKPESKHLRVTASTPPNLTHSHSSPLGVFVGSPADPDAKSEGQDGAGLADTYGSALSAYEQQLAYDREREQAEYVFEQERDKLRQLEYEHALARERERERERALDNVAEVVFFDYGVVVFFGLDERGERDVLEDIKAGGAMRRVIKEAEWEVEECHFAHDSQIAYPRIYNDFFTLKSRSHLLKLSIAHALAQSTLLVRYESLARHTLSSPMAVSIPRQMAESGSLQLRRHDALKLTGRLFKLRRDINLVSNVLDVPELFWSEASLKELYDAVREYMEIDPRVENLNEKLGVASDFLDEIHDHLNNNAMDRITRIIIWLIVVAILVELGEIVARLVVHSSVGGSGSFSMASNFGSRSLISGLSGGPSQHASPIQQMSKPEALEALERLMSMQVQS